MSRAAPPAVARLRGQAATDYLLVLALVSVALGIGADSPVQQLLGAIAEHYRRFTWSISLP
jgi:hypothetical protein